MEREKNQREIKHQQTINAKLFAHLTMETTKKLENIFRNRFHLSAAISTHFESVFLLFSFTRQSNKTSKRFWKKRKTINYDEHNYVESLSSFSPWCTTIKQRFYSVRFKFSMGTSAVRHAEKLISSCHSNILILFRCFFDRPQPKLTSGNENEWFSVLLINSK